MAIEAEAQLVEYRGLVNDAERAVERARSQLREIAAQAEAETHRAQHVVQAMIDDKLVAAELIGEAWADYETAVARARAQVLHAKATPAKAAAEEIRAKGKELAALRREAKYTQWVLKFYEARCSGRCHVAQSSRGRTVENRPEMAPERLRTTRTSRRGWRTTRTADASRGSGASRALVCLLAGAPRRTRRPTLGLVARTRALCRCVSGTPRPGCGAGRLGSNLRRDRTARVESGREALHVLGLEFVPDDGLR